LHIYSEAQTEIRKSSKKDAEAVDFLLNLEQDSASSDSALTAKCSVADLDSIGVKLIR